MRHLSSYEKETIINFNEAEATASIFTYNKAWQKHLEGKLGLKPTMDNSFGGKEYEIDKKRIPMPRAPRKLSAEARAKLTERLRQSRVLSARKPYAVGKSANKALGKGYKSPRTNKRDGKNKGSLTPLINSEITVETGGQGS